MALSPLTDETKRLLDALPDQRDLYEPGGLFVGKGHRPTCTSGAFRTPDQRGAPLP